MFEQEYPNLSGMDITLPNDKKLIDWEKYRKELSFFMFMVSS